MPLLQETLYTIEDYWNLQTKEQYVELLNGHPNKLNNRGCIAVPDWIIEIVSPSNCLFSFYKGYQSQTQKKRTRFL